MADFRPYWIFDRKNFTLEEKLYRQINEKYDNHYTDEFKSNWKRILDDCFIPWTKSMSELLELNLLLNNLHPDIK